MDFWHGCSKLGSAVRASGKARFEGVIETRVYLSNKHQVNGIDWGTIEQRGLRVGLDECSVSAAPGEPDTMNRTNSAYGRSVQWVYRAKRAYVYTDNGIVRTWQE